MGRKPTGTVLERGQVTIPKEIRSKLGIEPGTILEFAAGDGKLTARKASLDDPVTRVYGCLKSRKSTDELLRELRGSR